MERLKKPRGQNYSAEERLFLLEEVAKQKEIIECKDTDAFTNRKKDAIWRQICMKLNSNFAAHRTASSLKSWWDNTKRRTRKLQSIKKNEKITTEVEREIMLTIDPLHEKVKDIMGLDGHQNIDVSDTAHDEGSCSSVEVPVEEIDGSTEECLENNNPKDEYFAPASSERRQAQRSEDLFWEKKLKLVHGELDRTMSEARKREEIHRLEVQERKARIALIKAQTEIVALEKKEKETNLELKKMELNEKQKKVVVIRCNNIKNL